MRHLNNAHPECQSIIGGGGGDDRALHAWSKRHLAVSDGRANFIAIITSKWAAAVEAFSCFYWIYTAAPLMVEGGGGVMTVMQPLDQFVAVDRCRAIAAWAIQFQPGGTPHLKILDLREAIRDAGGRLPLDQYVVIPIRGGQTDDDARELWQTVQDYNAGTPGSCDLGVVLVVREGFPRGTPQQTGSASWIASRFKLWQLRLARCEVEVLAARAGGAFDRKDAFLARLGLGALREPVYSGD